VNEEWTVLTPSYGPGDRLVLGQRLVFGGWLLTYGYVENGVVRESALAGSVDISDAELAVLLQMARGEPADGPR